MELWGRFTDYVLMYKSEFLQRWVHIASLSLSLSVQCVLYSYYDITHFDQEHPNHENVKFFIPNKNHRVFGHRQRPPCFDGTSHSSRCRRAMLWRRRRRRFLRCQNTKPGRRRAGWGWLGWLLGGWVGWFVGCYVSLDGVGRWS